MHPNQWRSFSGNQTPWCAATRFAGDLRGGRVARELRATLCLSPVSAVPQAARSATATLFRKFANSGPRSSRISAKATVACR